MARHCQSEAHFFENENRGNQGQGEQGHGETAACLSLPMNQQFAAGKGSQGLPQIDNRSVQRN